MEIAKKYYDLYFNELVGLFSRESKEIGKTFAMVMFPKFDDYGYLLEKLNALD